MNFSLSEIEHKHHSVVAIGVGIFLKQKICLQFCSLTEVYFKAVSLSASKNG